MGLQKQIELPNGVIVNYHRIVRIVNQINQETEVMVHSYINKDKRNQLFENEYSDVYIHEGYYRGDPDIAFDATSAYEWLKTQEPFRDALDILDDSDADIYKKETIDEQ